MTVRRRRNRLGPLIVCLSLQAAMVAAQGNPRDTALTRQYLHEADSIAAGDGGLLWGLSLAGPMMLVDRDTRAIVANVDDGEGRLKQAGSVFVGTLPADQNVSNTGFNWAGRRWTMVALPVPKNPVSRAALMMHERWHRIQDSLGFPARAPPTTISIPGMAGCGCDSRAERYSEPWLPKARSAALPRATRCSFGVIAAS